jgi:hypothetical protein
MWRAWPLAIVCVLLCVVNRVRLPSFRREDIKWLGGVFTNIHFQVVKVRVGTKAAWKGREICRFCFSSQCSSSLGVLLWRVANMVAETRLHFARTTSETTTAISIRSFGDSGPPLKDSAYTVHYLIVGCYCCYVE